MTAVPDSSKPIRCDEKKSPLRVGLMIDGYVQPAWARSMLAEIVSSGFAELVLVVKRPEKPETETDRSSGLLARIRRLSLYDFYVRRDTTRTILRPDAFAPTDIRDLVDSRPVIEASPTDQDGTEQFSEEDVEAIRAHDLDVMLQMGFGELRGPILQCAKHGVWSYYHGDNNRRRGGPPGFWEVAEKHPYTGSVLEVLSDRPDGHRVIYRSYAMTRLDSVAVNKNNYYWKTSQFALRKLRDLYELGPDALASVDEHHIPYSDKPYKQPSNLRMIGILGSLYVRRQCKRMAERTGRDEWFMAFRFRESPSDPNDEFAAYRHIDPPKGHFWADPFPVKHDGRYFIFFEDYAYDILRGHISVIEVRRDGAWTDPTPVLVRDYHLSYPFVFEYDGRLFMIPESGRHDSVELYVCDEFPGKWRLHSELLSGVKAVDTTLWVHDGRWWMFAAQGIEGAMRTDELFLYHADTPLGPWIPHRRNPVKSDVRSARPAGSIFEREGRCYRPSQDCSRGYGSAIVINEIQVISPDEYRESEVARITPTWAPGLRATHTLNCADELGVIDGMRRASRYRR